MSTFKSIADITTLIISIQGLGIICLLFKSGKFRLPKIILITLILVLILVIMSVIAHANNLTENYPQFLLLHQPLIFTIFPLLFFYILSVVREKVQLKAGHAIHLILPVFVFINLIPFYFSGVEKSGSTAFLNQFVPLSRKWHLIILCFTGLLYAISAVSEIKKYNRTIKNTFSTTRSVNPVWLRTDLYLIWGSWFLILTRLLSNYKLETQSFSLFLLSLIIVAAGYNGLRFDEIFTEAPWSGLKYRNSRLTERKAKEFLGKLKRTVEEKQLYKRENLTIRDVAEELSIPSYYLSQVINQQLNSNFFDFINKYRIELAKKLLMTLKDNPTILRIVYESGFNSKSAFYTAFKKHTGYTPTEFKSANASGLINQDDLL